MVTCHSYAKNLIFDWKADICLLNTLILVFNTKEDIQLKYIMLFFKIKDLFRNLRSVFSLLTQTQKKAFDVDSQL